MTPLIIYMALEVDTHKHARMEVIQETRRMPGSKFGSSS